MIIKDKEAKIQATGIKNMNVIVIPAGSENQFLWAWDQKLQMVTNRLCKNPENTNL